MITEALDRRRRRLLLAAGISALLPATTLAALMPTPRQSPGPFYPVELPLDDDNDLTRVEGMEGVAEGVIVDLHGHALTTSGHPIPSARIEIWQCDHRGVYLHPGDRRFSQRDNAFQGHGVTYTDAKGRYRFRTIRPVPYPGRTPHIHVVLVVPGQAPLVSQIYIRDEPANRQDFLFRQVPVEQRHLLLADFVSDGTVSGVQQQARFDLVLGATPIQS